METCFNLEDFLFVTLFWGDRFMLSWLLHQNHLGQSILIPKNKIVEIVGKPLNCQPSFRLCSAPKITNLEVENTLQPSWVSSKQNSSHVFWVSDMHTPSYTWIHLAVPFQRIWHSPMSLYVFACHALLRNRTSKMPRVSAAAISSDPFD